jgi:transcriptional regulator with XRE-family HTH domain
VRKRFRAPPVAADLEIGVRVRQVRKEARISERLAAEQMGISRSQLVRIESGRLAARFLPTWSFCRLTNTNPLWLAFGDDSLGRYGFIECANSDVPEAALFFDAMRLSAIEFLEFREAQIRLYIRVGAVFAKLAPLSPKEMRLTRPPHPTEATLAQIMLAFEQREFNSRSMSVAEIANWEDLRLLLKEQLSVRGAKTSIAQLFGISTQAVSHWLSGASAPSGDVALQLRKMLIDGSLTNTMQPKKSAGSAETRPAPKTRKGKIANEKTRSNRKKQ